MNPQDMYALHSFEEKIENLTQKLLALSAADEFC